MKQYLPKIIAALIGAAAMFIIMLNARNINLTAQDIDILEGVRTLSNIKSINIDNYGFDRNWQVNVYVKSEAGRINLESKNKDLSKAIQEIIQKHNQINGVCE